MFYICTRYVLLPFLAYNCPCCASLLVTTTTVHVMDSKEHKGTRLKSLTVSMLSNK